MEIQLQKSLAGYFSCLSTLDDICKELLKDAAKPLSSLQNYGEQLRLISSVGVGNVDISNFEDMQARLLFKINVGIEDEIGLLADIVSRFHSGVQELKNKLTTLNSVRNKVDPKTPEMEAFVSGTPYRPRLDSLMKWALDGHIYYRELYSSMNSSLRNLDCRDEKTVTNLVQSFTEDKHKRAEVNRILAFTQFVAKEAC